MDTVEDNDLKPLQEGGVGQGLGRRGVDPPIGVRGAAWGVKRWCGHYTKYRRRPNFEKDHKIKIVRGMGFKKINDLRSKVKVTI